MEWLSSIQTKMADEIIIQRCFTQNNILSAGSSALGNRYHNPLVALIPRFSCDQVSNLSRAAYEGSLVGFLGDLCFLDWHHNVNDGETLLNNALDVLQNVTHRSSILP